VWAAFCEMKAWPAQLLQAKLTLSQAQWPLTHLPDMDTHCSR
jgi:hypothetical protein